MNDGKRWEYKPGGKGSCIGYVGNRRGDILAQVYAPPTVCTIADAHKFGRAMAAALWRFDLSQSESGSK